jgi:hypothetical protein
MTRKQLTRVNISDLTKNFCHFFKSASKGDLKMTWHQFKKEDFKKISIYPYIKKIKVSDAVTIKKIPCLTPVVGTEKQIDAV